MISFLRPVMYSRPCGVEAAEVARVQPAVAQRRGRGVGPVEVAAHDDRAADQDLAVGARFRRRPPAVGRRDAHLDAGSGWPTVSKAGSSGRVIVAPPEVSVRP